MSTKIIGEVYTRTIANSSLKNEFTELKEEIIPMGIRSYSVFLYIDKNNETCEYDINILHDFDEPIFYAGHKIKSIEGILEHVMYLFLSPSDIIAPLPYISVDQHKTFVTLLKVLSKENVTIKENPMQISINDLIECADDMVSDFRRIYIHYQIYLLMSKFKIVFDKEDIISPKTPSKITNTYNNAKKNGENSITIKGTETDYFTKQELFIIYIMTSQVNELKNLLHISRKRRF